MDATRIIDKRYGNGMANDTLETRVRKQRKLYHVKEHSRNNILHVNHVVCSAPIPSKHSKPVVEDLYKIPPELLRTTKRKKMLGFISKCLVPTACVS